MPKPKRAPKPPVVSSVPVVRFFDDFLGTALDRATWATVFPWGYRSQPGNGQEHVDDAFSVANSILRIRADRRDVVDANYGPLHYTSGIITSYPFFRFTYGTVEVRAKCPAGRGFWTALWTLPVDMSWPPEIDVLELLGVEPKVAHLNYHGTGASSRGAAWTAPSDLTADFHVYATEWTPGELIWRIDGVERFRCPATMTGPMYVLVELKVGGAGDTWAGEPDASTVFPSYLDIDYVRVSQ